MKYKLLGRSGLRVSEFALGTMTFGEDWGWGAAPDECRAMYEAYRAAGGNFIDTADIYTNGSSERIVGDLIASERERIVLATKYTMSTDRSDPNMGGNHRKHLVQALDASLKRLHVDYVDLLWLHAWDFLTPVDEVMRALDDQVRAGKVLYVGVSDTPAWVVAQANTLADARGWAPFVALQIDYSLVQRTPELELLPMAHALDLAVTPWGPLGSGVLSGKYDQTGAATGGEAARTPGAHRLTQRNLRIAVQLREIAAELGEPSAAVALAWLLSRGPAPVIPILGARRADQLAENLRAAELRLPDEELRRLDEVSAIELTFPQRFLQADDMRRSVHGDTFGKVEDHRGRLPR
jgi:aryl-alcohol dehydrogenase-like predicted oxidoreductase